MDTVVTKVKICGITNVEDAALSVASGADMVGFNFYENSPRFVSVSEASEIGRDIPDSVMRIGVFVNENVERIAETVRTVRLNAVQLHGDETLEFVSELKKRIDCDVIKAYRVTAGFDAGSALWCGADALLLDGFSKHARGGTGETFDWDVAREMAGSVKLYLAGGLSAENVRLAIEHVRPYAVDACSLLESSPGKKDADKLRRFIREAKLG